MNWDDLRFFLVLARKRTLSAAARELRVSQPTVGRRITALERRIGAKLFVREPDGFALSSSGSAALELAEQIERDALALERRLVGRDEGIRGNVRVSASEWLITHVLCPLVGALRERHPELTLDLIADTRHLDLTRREADIALRPRRFEHDTVIQRATTKIGFALYGAPEYLAKNGVPRAGDGSGHTLIGMSDGTGDVARAWLAEVLPNAHVAIRANGRDAMLALAECGAGLACLARVVGDATPLVRLSKFPPAPTPTLWMGVHRDTHQIARVRAVATYLVERLRASSSDETTTPRGRK